jgi:hypothetical protein
MRKQRFVALALGAVLAVGAGCVGSSEGSTDTSGEAAAPQGGSEPACELFTDAEVTEAIGEHDGGQHDPAFGGCMWSAKVPVKGHTEEVRAVVVPEDTYRELTNLTGSDRKTVDGFGEGSATYTNIYGELWFRCGGQWCGVVAHTYYRDKREQVARKLAQALDSRR